MSQCQLKCGAVVTVNYLQIATPSWRQPAVLLNLFGDGFTGFLAEKGFDWKRLAGAEIIEIGGQPALSV